jgi:methyl-accepting chemotaxis protein
MKLSFKYNLVKKTQLEMCSKKIAMLEDDILQATEFVKNIENGNLDVEFNFNQDQNKEQNILAESLISMRDQMRKIAEQEKQRNWVNEGMARFVEILRNNSSNIKDLSENILVNLIKYLGANQGYLFVCTEEGNQKFLDLAACYAYNRKKHISKRINIGEGLVGQAYLEQDSIYMTSIPPDYVNITSGIGQALPRNIVIVPLKINDIVYGVVEMASFQKIEKFQIEFLEKLGESIASTLANAKVTENTQKLLNEARLMAEQLRAQEEEVRQNMEELSATQEELSRRANEIEQIRKSEKERADYQIQSQKLLMEQFVAKTKEKENALLAKIKELESKLVSEEVAALF